METTTMNPPPPRFILGGTILIAKAKQNTMYEAIICVFAIRSM
jgi:hypothetical protein